ncbi:TPA: HEPN domain-containing protein [Pseudomonas aeruginosa]
MRIEKEYKKTGYFWLAGSSEKKIPGTLTIADGGKIDLEVLGNFETESNESLDDAVLGRVIGVVEDDGLITLEDCFYKIKNMAFGGIATSKVHVNSAMSGAEWEKDEEVKFESVSFSVDCLDEWVGISGIKVEHDWEARTASINYSPIEKISAQLDNGMTLEVCFGYTLPGSPAITEAKITQNTYFKLRSEELRDLEEFITVIGQVMNLMCFAMDEVVTVKNISAKTPEIQRSFQNGDSVQVPISIYYESSFHPEKIPNKKWHDMLFSFGAIKSNFGEIVNNWLKAYDYMSPALSLYFSTKKGAQKYLDGKFLALAQGLETYHRRTSTETLMSAESFETLVAEVMENCPPDHAEWLKGRLTHGNEINLGKRLKRIVEPFKAHLGTSGERSKLLRSIVDTRNYLTHYSENLKDTAATGRELWRLCIKMEVIFNLHFLKVIGFTDEEIDAVVKNCYPLNRKIKE